MKLYCSFQVLLLSGDLLAYSSVTHLSRHCVPVLPVIFLASIFQFPGPYFSTAPRRIYITKNLNKSTANHSVTEIPSILSVHSVSFYIKLFFTSKGVKVQLLCIGFEKSLIYFI